MKVKNAGMGLGMTLGAALLLAGTNARAFERYNDGCADCHGSFTGSTSTKGSQFPGGNKHSMHNGSSYMKTDCDLCHTDGDGRDPFTGSSNGTTGVPGLGCTGCHNAVGLRRHHAASGVVECGDCHDDSGQTPPGENFNPPYYGTAYTRANFAGNLVHALNTNENWTLNDYVGLDNDGNDLYDGNDPACGIAVRGCAPTGTQTRVVFNTMQGVRYRVDAATSPASWSPLVTNILGTGLDAAITDPSAPAAGPRLYRVVLQY